jgi:branched-chain amino acid transport system permease protein
MVYLGGVSTIMGPVVGAVVLSVLSEVLQGNYPYQFTIILGALIIFLVLFLPKGVLGEIKALTERLRARTSK